MENNPQPDNSNEPGNSLFSSQKLGAESLRNKYILFGVAVAVGLLLMAAILLMLNKADVPGGAKNIFNAGFTDWLKPIQEVKVGPVHYMNPCQVLPQDELAKVYGDIGADGYIQQEYLDQSSSSSVSEVTSLCSYELKNSKIANASLSVTQYRDESALKSLRNAFGLTRVEDAEVALAEYKKYVDGANNKDATELFERMTSSVATFKQYENVFEESKLASLSTDGLLVPGENDLTLIQRNAAYSFTLTPQRVTKQPTTDEIVGEIANVKKTIDIIEKNAKNASLTQSPAKTIIGDNDVSGSTKILEACAVLTPEVFSTIAGKAQNDTVKRLSTYKDVTKDRLTSVDKTILLPYNTCERAYSRYNDPSAIPSTQNVTTVFEIKYAKSGEKAKEWIAKYYPVEAGDMELQSNADWAVNSQIGTDASARYYYFRVGPYIASIKINKLVSEGLTSGIEQSVGTPEEHLKAINELTDSLRAHQSAVEKS